MNGHVDSAGRALVSVKLLTSEQSTVHEIPAWIDTGFNGELVLPNEQIKSLQLKPSGTLKAVLADGSEVSLQRYSCQIEWFDTIRELEVVANEGQYPLLGVGLLLGHDLHISYRTSKLSVE